MNAGQRTEDTSPPSPTDDEPGNSGYEATDPASNDRANSEAERGKQKRPLQPADLCRLRSVADVRLHPDSTSAVYVVTWPDAESDANRSVLYATNVDGTSNRQLTYGHRDTAPVFSADGSNLAFIRSEPESPDKLMVLSWPVGEITEVACFQDGASGVQWLDGGQLVALAARRPESQDGAEDEELARRPRIITTNDYRYNGRGFIHDRPNQLFIVPAALGGQDGPRAQPVEIGMPGVDHTAFAVSPDGRRLAAVCATDQDGDQTGANHIWLYQIDGSQVPQQLTANGGYWTWLTWHPDGQLVATGQTDAGRVGFQRPHIIGRPDDGPVPAITALEDQDLNVSPSKASSAVPVSGAMLYPGVRHGRIAIDRYELGRSPEGKGRTVIHEGDHQVTAFDSSPDGSVTVAAITSPTSPAELWRVDHDGTRLTALNDKFLQQIDLATTESIHVPSTEGIEVNAFLVRPPASAPGSDHDRPGLVYVHGGPMFQYGLNFFDEFQMAAACGYVVIGGNPRGSDGYGEAWANAITGDFGNRDWLDVSALADYLQALPEVDEGRIGIGGGSYGGFMTGWALSHDDHNRFKAGLIERAVTSWNTMFGTSDIGAWFCEMSIGASIESNVAEVTRQSPLYYAADITCPTLIIHSEEDWRCPIEQAEQLFAAMRRNGGDATFVRFPGENHELSRSGRPSHRVERLQIVHEFFAKHLGGADFGSDLL